MKQYYNLTISEYSNIPLKLKDIERELEKDTEENLENVVEEIEDDYDRLQSHDHKR